MKECVNLFRMMPFWMFMMGPYITDGAIAIPFLQIIISLLCKTFTIIKIQKWALKVKIRFWKKILNFYLRVRKCSTAVQDLYCKKLTNISNILSLFSASCSSCSWNVYRVSKIMNNMIFSFIRNNVLNIS